MMKRRGRESFGVVLFGILTATVDAHASVVLKSIQEKSPSEIEVVFDTQVSRNQLQLEYFRDIVQLSIKGSVVYPSKMLTLSGEPFLKGFAYQYTPQWVRLRLTAASGKADDLKKQIHMHISGKTVRLRWAKSDALVMSAAKPQVARAVDAPDEDRSAKQQELLNKILKESDKPSAPTVKKPAPRSNPLLGFAWLGVIALGMLVLAFVFRRSSKSAHLKRWFLKNTWIKDPSIVEVLAHHSLGPKKNISVVRVKGKTLVLGVTEDSISLISQLESDGEGWSDPSAQSFDSTLITQTLLPKTSATAAAKPVAPTHYRSQLREKLKGLKTL